MLCSGNNDDGDPDQIKLGIRGMGTPVGVAPIRKGVRVSFPATLAQTTIDDNLD
jgi:hypothetical protein